MSVFQSLLDVYNNRGACYVILIDPDNKNDDLKMYSNNALSRVWKAIRFSWWMTTTFHKFPQQSSFDQRIQDSEIEYLENSVASQRVLAENYVGLPY